MKWEIPVNMKVNQEADGRKGLRRQIGSFEEGSAMRRKFWSRIASVVASMALGVGLLILSYPLPSSAEKITFSLGLDRPWVIGHSGEGIRPHAASAT